MFTESKTNTLAIAHALRRHPGVYESFEDSGVEISPCSSPNIWTRDWHPIPVGDHFVKFGYDGYGDETMLGRESLHVYKKDWEHLSDVRVSKIRLDGGNIVREGDIAIITDMVFKHNPMVKNLLGKLERLLRCEVVIIPSEPGCCIGHSDGVVHFVPGTKKILLQDYRRIGEDKMARYFDTVSNILTKRFQVFTIPCGYPWTPPITPKNFRKEYPQADLFLPAFGLYINFLVVGKTVFFPSFNCPEDDAALSVVETHFPKYKIITIDCRRLSMEGGVLNCVAMGYKL